MLSERTTTLSDKSSLSSLSIGRRCRPGFQALGRAAHQPGLVPAALSTPASTDLTIPKLSRLSAEGSKPTAASRGLHAERGF